MEDHQAGAGKCGMARDLSGHFGASFWTSPSRFASTGQPTRYVVVADIPRTSLADLACPAPQGR